MDPVKAQHQQLQKNISILEDTNSWCKALRIAINSRTSKKSKSRLIRHHNYTNPLVPGVH